MTSYPSHVPLWLGQAAPRYTSYPPATQFRMASPGEGVAELKKLAGVESVSLYLHIPFCRELCLFCGCHQVITKRAERTVQYLISLHHEIDLVAGLYPQKFKVAHLHFGGGSPSTLTPEQMHELMTHLRAKFYFLPEAELAIELDPRTTTPDFIRTLAAEGFNRASLGVQDFDDKVQQTVNRIQPYPLVKEVVDNLYAAGLTALSLDLMYGLPYQTPESLTATAKLALSLNPARLSLFSYAHVPGMKSYQKKLEEAGLPSDAEKLEQERCMRAILLANGYRSIGIDHFAKPNDPLYKALESGNLHRNFQGYTDDPSPYLLGLGASSISYTGSAYVQNEPDLTAYQNSLNEGQFLHKRLCPCTPHDCEVAQVISSLMCYFEVATPATLPARLQPFIETGLVEQSGGRLVVDQTYPMAVRAVAACFDEYYDAKKISSRVA